MLVEFYLNWFLVFSLTVLDSFIHAYNYFTFFIPHCPASSPTETPSLL